MVQNYNLGQTERLSVFENWLGRVGLQLIATLTKEEQYACFDNKNPYETLRKNTKAHFYEMIKSLQVHQLVCWSKESVEV